MVKLNFVILCDNAFLAQETNSLNIIGIFSRISTKGFPATHPKLMVATNMNGDPGEYDQSIIIKNKTTNEEVAKVSGRLIIRTPKQKAQFLASFFNVVFKTPGEYEIEVYIDDELQDLTTSFYVGEK